MPSFTPPVLFTFFFPHSFFSHLFFLPSPLIFLLPACFSSPSSCFVSFSPPLIPPPHPPVLAQSSSLSSSRLQVRPHLLTLSESSGSNTGAGAWGGAGAFRRCVTLQHDIGRSISALSRSRKRVRVRMFHKVEAAPLRLT